MLRRRRAPRRPVAAAVAAALLLGGCSGTADEPDAAPGASSSPSASPSATPSPSPLPSTPASSAPAAPAPPERPEPRRGAAGQKAFAHYVVEAWRWSLRSNDAAPLLDASPSRRRPCLGCETLAEELRRRADAGWYVDLGTVTVDRTRLRREGDVVVATSRVDVPESDSYFEDGGYRSSSPAHANATFTVRMRQRARDYVLLSFTVG